MSHQNLFLICLLFLTIQITQSLLLTCYCNHPSCQSTTCVSTIACAQELFANNSTGHINRGCYENWQQYHRRDRRDDEDEDDDEEDSKDNDKRKERKVTRPKTKKEHVDKVEQEVECLAPWSAEVVKREGEVIYVTNHYFYDFQFAKHPQQFYFIAVIQTCAIMLQRDTLFDQLVK